MATQHTDLDSPNLKDSLSAVILALVPSLTEALLKKLGPKPKSQKPPRKKKVLTSGIKA